MTTTLTTGEIRPKSARPIQPHNQIVTADGEVVGVIHWVQEATVIKRIRRKLAQHHNRLVITREGTPARADLGEYAVLDAEGEVLQRDADLTALARFLGVLSPEEHIDPGAARDRNWRHHVAKYTIVEVGGIRVHHHERVTRDYTTLAAARKAAARLGDREDLILVSFDASSGKGGRHD